MQIGQSRGILDDVSDTLGADPRLAALSRFSRGPMAMRGVDQVFRALGSTDDGRRWALAALHPCDEELTPPEGIPDLSSTTVASPSLRNTSTISSLVSTGEFVDASWDCQVICPPIPEIDYLYRQKLAGTTTWGDWNLVRPASFPASADGTATTLLTTGYSRYRYQGRGYTFQHIASGLTNEGTLFAGQVQATESSQYSPEFATAPTSPEGRAWQTVINPPAFPQDLVQEDSLAVQWQAKHGAYMPLRFVDTVHLYRPAAGDGVITGGAASVPASWAYVSSATTAGGVPTVNTIVKTPTPVFTTPGSTVTAVQMAYGASPAGNLLTGIFFFMGINSKASFEVKSRMHLENQVARDGFAVQPFVHSPPVYDREALEIVGKVGQVQKHAYYAVYNDLGQILNSIWGAIRSVGSPIAKVLAGSGIPVLSTVGNIAGKLIRGVEAGMA